MPDENPQPTPSIHEQDGKGPSRTGDIRIGANSPITGSTINTGIINLGPPKPYILTTEDQRKAQGKLLTASARLHLVCIGRGCQSADSLCSAFSGTCWIVSRTIIGQFISVGSDVDLSAGIHIMAQDADPSALQSLRSALEVLPIRYELAPWMPIGGPPPDTRLILVFGNPE